MAKNTDHNPQELGLAIHSSIVNSVESPHLIPHIVKRIKLQQKKQSGRLARIVNDDYGGCRLLHYCAEFGNAQVCKLLLGCGAKPNLKDKAGNTPLHIAARFERLDCIEILRDYGADLLAENDAKATPQQMAVDHFKPEAVKKLLELEGKVVTPIVEHNKIDIRANREAIGENRDTSKRNESTIAQLTDKVKDLEAKLKTSETLRDADQTKLVNLQQEQAKLVGDLQQEQAKMKEEMNGKIETLETMLVNLQDNDSVESNTVCDHDRRLCDLEEAVFKEHVESSRSQTEALYDELQRSYCTLLQQLDGQMMRSFLCQKKVLSWPEMQRITADPMQQTERLLVTLFNKSPCCWVNAFLETLKTTNPALYGGFISSSDDTAVKEPCDGS